MLPDSPDKTVLFSLYILVSSADCRILAKSLMKETNYANFPIRICILWKYQTRLAFRLQAIEADSQKLDSTIK